MNEVYGNAILGGCSVTLAREPGCADRQVPTEIAGLHEAITRLEKHSEILHARLSSLIVANSKACKDQVCDSPDAPNVCETAHTIRNARHRVESICVAIETLASRVEV